MNRTLIATFAAGLAIATVAPAPAQARQGCGNGWHRGPHGRCISNRAGRPVLVIGTYYRGHGYWDGHRYWRQRYRDHDRHWRYRN